MSTQTVYRLQDQKSHHSIKLSQEPIPSIDKHEVLVKIRAIALNYRDIAISNGTYPFSIKDQLVPCSDGAGKVVEVGSSIDDLKVGAHVVATFNANNLYGPLTEWGHAYGGTIDGMLRQYIAVPRSVLVEIPKKAKMSFPEMASLVCTGVTAWNALYGNLPLRPGQTVLFQGTGGVSVTGLRIAKAAGATTIITSSSDEKLKLVKEKYGADYVINYKTTPDWAAEAQKITEGKGVDYIIENGGSGTIKQSIDAITPGGSIALIGFLAQAKQEDMPNVALLTLSKGCIVRGINVGSKQLLEELVQFVGAKQIAPPVEKVFGFSNEQVMAAYDFLASGNHVGKVCISLD